MSGVSENVGRSAAITGAGSGLGREIAIDLAAKGYVVFGTAASAAEVWDLKEASGGRIRLTVCDITKEQAVRAWIDDVSQALGDDGLDLLVSNAGICAPGKIEILPLASIKREFDVNGFADRSVINAFIPALRNAHGRIAQISTWTSCLPLSLNGSSGASTAVTKAFGTAYCAELQRFGIDVLIAAPEGNVKPVGGESGNALAHVAETMTPEQREPFDRRSIASQPSSNSMQGGGIDASLAAKFATLGLL